MKKDKVIELFNQVDKFTIELEALKEERKSLIDKLKSSEDKKEHAMQIFCLDQYTSLLFEDTKATIQRMIQAYTDFIVMGGSSKDFSTEEQKILEDYIEGHSLNFIISDSKVKTKREDLRETLVQQAMSTGFKEKSFIGDYIIQLEK